MGALENAPLAVFKRRQVGETRLAALDGGDPPLLVEFEIPGGLVLAQAEAAAARAMSVIRESPAYLSRYGLEERRLSDDEIGALARVVTAMETAFLLWRDWTAAHEVDGRIERRPLTEAHIAEVLLDQNLRMAWLVHLDAASPLERAEGNGSGVSPNGSSEEAPNTAEAASGAEAPAPAAAEAEPAISVPD